MTIKEYFKALKKLSQEEFKEFNLKLGGGQKTIDERLKEFTYDSKHERIICYYLMLETEEEKITSASISSSKSSRYSTIAAFIAVLIALCTILNTCQINKKQLSIIEKEKEINYLSEKNKLKILFEKFSNKLSEYYEDSNSKPFEPLKLGETRITQIESDLMRNYNVQNKWAKELKELLSSGVTNSCLLQNEQTLKYWMDAIMRTNQIISMTDSFILKNMFFEEVYNFKKLYSFIHEDFVYAHKSLFDKSDLSEK